MLHIDKGIVSFPNSDQLVSPIPKFVTGKRIAVIGGSPRIAGTNLGKRIDSYDVVVRVNVHWPCPRRLLGGVGIKKPFVSLIPDIGHRTDILFHNGNKLGGSFGEITKLKELKMIVMLDCSDRKDILDPTKEWCKNKSIEFLWFNKFHNHISIHEGLSGIKAIKVLLESNPIEVFVSGFDFYQTEKDFDAAWNYHDPASEAKFFKENIITDNRIVLADNVRC